MKKIGKKAIPTKEKEKLSIKVTKVERVLGNTAQGLDVKEGYAHFKVSAIANKRNITFFKRIRLDKPERMTEKFVSKIVPFVSRQYTEGKYFVASGASPSFDINFVNKQDVFDTMLGVFDQIYDFVRSGKAKNLKTSIISFK